MPLFPDPVYLVSSKKDQTYLPIKVTLAMQSGLVAFMDDIPMGMGVNFNPFLDEDYYLFDDVYDEPYFGMSDDDEDLEDGLGFCPFY